MAFTLSKNKNKNKIKKVDNSNQVNIVYDNTIKWIADYALTELI